MTETAAAPPLVAHLIYRLDVGGLENGLINLLQHLPRERFRHAVICLAGYTHWRERLSALDVPVYTLDKQPGLDAGVHLRLWRLLRRLRPQILHTRNTAALEGQVAAWCAGVPVRVHGEHGRDERDPHGTNPRYLAMRRALRPAVHHYIALSRELEQYLAHTIGVRAQRLTRITNGVDTARFCPPAAEARALPADAPFNADHWVVGTVGRMQPVKGTLDLVEAFILLLRERPEAHARARLVLIGDGDLRAEAERRLCDAGLRELAWLPGARDDVAQILRGLDLFVLPSLTEGISNTLLEAMASACPVVATRVGGNVELVDEDRSGTLVAAANPAAMAQAMGAYFADAALSARHGAAARSRALEHYSMAAMAASYAGVYERLLAARGRN